MRQSFKPGLCLRLKEVLEQMGMKEDMQTLIFRVHREIPFRQPSTSRIEGIYK